MDIKVRKADARVPVTIFEVSGDIDIMSSPELLSQANASIADGTRNVLIDLSGVGYVSSAGIRVLHQMFLMLRTDLPEESEAVMLEGLRAGNFVSPHLKLAHPSERVREAIETTGMDMYLAIYPTLEEALAAF